MDANALPLSGGDSSAPCPGELVVQNGRHAGARRPLTAPLTLIGSAPGCDVRLNVEAVAAQHCALFQGPAGLVLRDLGSADGTYVNEQRVGTCLLRDGDIVSVGPFQFRVRWEGILGGPAAEPVPRPGEADALRIQAAAVAAQQAALLDEENRLQQRRAALEKQEEQLAAHLEERRLTLVAMQEEVRQEKSLLLQERTAFEQEKRTRLEETARHRDETALALKRAQAERGRLSELRRRLCRRWRRHWKCQEKELESRRLLVTGERARLQGERAALLQARLRFNGEAELGRRQLHDGWEELNKAQCAWQATRQREAAELARQKRELHSERDALVSAQRTVAAQLLQAQSTRVTLEKEAEGLENRIRNLRLKVAEYEAELARLRAETGVPSVSTVAAGLQPADSEASPSAGWKPAAMAELHDEGSGQLGRLDVLAGVLADQRLQLAEQWERFLLAQRAWHEEHVSLPPQIADAARHLEEKERHLATQEQMQEAIAADLRTRQRALSQLRSELEGWQARLTVTEAAWRNERTTLVVQAQTREGLAQRRAGMLETQRKRWAVRRKEEFEQLTRELKRSREAQRQYAELREDCERRAGDLGAHERALAARSLALEQFQLELIGRSDNSVAAEKRLQRLQRQITGMHAEAERRLTERRQTLEDEAERLRSQGHHLHQRAENLLARESSLSSKQTEWEHQQQETQHAQEKQQQELLRLRQQAEAATRHRKELQDEMDRVIRVMLEEAEPVPPAVWAA